MILKLLIEQAGHQTEFERDCLKVTVGRSTFTEKVDVNLDGDKRISRMQAVIWFERGAWWVADSHSRYGTLLDGREIRGHGPQSFPSCSVLQIGGCSITHRSPAVADDDEDDATICHSTLGKGATPRKTDTAPRVASRPPIENQPGVIETLPALQSGIAEPGDRPSRLEQHLEMLCELPAKLGAERKLEGIFPVALAATRQILPENVRGAILMAEEKGKHLLLKAHHPPGFRPSEDLSRAAMSRGEAYSWHQEAANVEGLPQGAGLVVPIVRSGIAVGAIYIDDPARQAPFPPLELRLLRAVAQATGLVIDQHESRRTLERQTEFMNRLFSSRFPETLRKKLAKSAADGTLPLGTQRSEVTVLISDIRGFTQLSIELGAHKLGDLLNEYFPPLTEAILRYGGSIDRFVGDAVFAVFGSPEPDADQQENAVRAALAMQEVVRSISASRAERNQPICGIGIGIDSGELLHGFVGNSEYLQFTIIGDAANFASRYCSAALAGEILISSSVHQHVWKFIRSEPRVIETKHEGLVEARLVHGLG